MIFRDRQTNRHFIIIYISPSTSGPQTITCRAILSETKAVNVGGGSASKAAFVGANNVIGPGCGFHRQMKLWSRENCEKVNVPCLSILEGMIVCDKRSALKSIILNLISFVAHTSFPAQVDSPEREGQPGQRPWSVRWRCWSPGWTPGTETGSSCFQVNYFVEFLKDDGKRRFIDWGAQVDLRGMWRGWDQV